MKRDDSVESARAGLLRDFEPLSDYNTGIQSFGNENYDSYGGNDTGNDRFDRGAPADDYSDFSSDGLRAFSTTTTRVGPPPRGLFDDI